MQYQLLTAREQYNEPGTAVYSCNGMQDSQLDTIQQRLKQASDARAQEVAGSEVLYSGDANLTDEQIAKLPFALYRQGYEYYWKTHAHPNIFRSVRDIVPSKRWLL